MLSNSQGWFHGMSTIKTQRSQKKFSLRRFCRAFNGGHFGKKISLITRLFFEL